MCGASEQAPGEKYRISVIGLDLLERSQNWIVMATVGFNLYLTPIFLIPFFLVALEEHLIPKLRCNGCLDHCLLAPEAI